uniref:Uncharacterized protein n=1 Tax=Pararge aegeria TaxID=116150 RepID=S4P834_9NEOP
MPQSTSGEVLTKCLFLTPHCCIPVLISTPQVEEHRVKLCRTRSRHTLGSVALFIGNSFPDTIYLVCH